MLWVAVALVVASFGYALAYVGGVAPGSQATPTMTCTPTPTQSTAQGGFVLNVYNSSGEEKRADTAGDALKTRGFDVGIVGNDPYKKTLDGVGEVRAGATGQADAQKYVMPLVPGAKLVQDGRTDGSIDLAVGKDAPTIQPDTASPQPTALC